MDQENFPEERFDFDSSFGYLVDGLDCALMSSCLPGGETNHSATYLADDLVSSDLHCFQTSSAGFDIYQPQPENIYEDLGAVNLPDPYIDTMFDAATLPVTELSTPMLNQSTLQNLSENESIIQLKSAIRNVVCSKAAADPNCISRKEKRRDTAIELYLQRWRDASAEDAGFILDSSMTNFSSPRSAQGSLNTGATSLSPSTPASSISSSKVEVEVEAPRSKPAAGGVEMVLDLNMNASTCLPKKQKPRTRAQRESYINVRRNGACEKHRKQHKKVGRRFHALLSILGK